MYRRAVFVAVISIATLLSPIVLFSADLSGDWIAFAIRPDGSKAQLMLRLKQDGEKLSGIVSLSSADLAIQNGKANGDEFSFQVQTNFGERSRTLNYTGRVTANEIQLSFSGFQRRPPLEYKGRRATPEESAANWPQRIPPPALHPVPDNGLARTPPMGWNSWNHFHGSIDDKTVREIADAMVADGMKNAGYIYVNIDDTWEAGRDAQGNIQTNSKFPDMKALANYVHAKGLKIGIYSSPGTKTCAGFEGSYGHETQDAKTWAAWGIDYLKYDWCSAGKIYQDADMQAVYQKMGDALEAAGRPIVFSLCQYGRERVWQWGPAVGGNSWRTTGDISDNWQSMTRILSLQDSLEKWAKPGHWNDPDMLEIGNGGMTDAEYRTHMTMWCMLAAPLLAGNDLRTASRDTLDILENPEVIAVDQDSLGKQAHRISSDRKPESDNKLAVWAKPLADGSQAVALFNGGDATATLNVKWTDLGLKGSLQVRDLWAGADKGRLADGYSTQLASHGVALIKVKK